MEDAMGLECWFPSTITSNNQNNGFINLQLYQPKNTIQA